MSDATDGRAAFVARLARLAADDERAVLAVLRRGSGRELGEHGESTAAFYRLAVPSPPAYEERWWYLLATLYAQFPGRSAPAGGSLPKALNALTRERGVNRDGVDRRFAVLLDADAEALPFRLRQLLGLFRGHEARWSWASLLDDLCAWTHPDRFIQKRWAREYFTGRADDAPAATAAERESSDAD